MRFVNKVKCIKSIVSLIFLLYKPKVPVSANTNQAVVVKDGDKIVLGGYHSDHSI